MDKESKDHRDALFNLNPRFTLAIASSLLRPALDKWLRTPNGYAADQRLEDLKHLLINRQRRGL